MFSPDPESLESSRSSAVDLQGQLAALRRHISQLEQEISGLRTRNDTHPLSRAFESHAPVFVFAFARDGIITLSEGHALPSTGPNGHEILGHSFFEVYADVPQLVAYAHRALAGDACTAQVTLGGQVFEIYYTPVRQGRVITGVSGLAIDVTTRFQAIEALTHQALHDPLTKLPNRALFLDRLELAVAGSNRGHQSLAVLLLDLDRFKEINDTFGHHYGDLLLQQAAVRLHDALRDTDTFARLGGDEFGILLPENDQAEAMHAAHRLTALLEKPFIVDDHMVRIGGSFGIASYPEDGLDAADLLRHADVAMYLAKQSQHGPVAYAPQHDQHSPHRLALVGELREAISGDGLLLHYQPVVDLPTRRVTSVEALVRWQHPVHGLLMPAQFVPMAESTGLISPLTEWVLEEALAQRQRWHQDGLTLEVAVNLSMSALHESRLVDTTQHLLRRYDVPPSALRLEITETALMRDAARTLEILTSLADFGVCLVIDDFGTGYSSLAHLRNLPMTEMKIDHSFVRDMVSHEKDAAIISSTIGLGHGLGLRVTAEGVESEAIWEQLQTRGCDGAQGYYISQPRPADALTSWLARGAWQVA